MQKRVFILMLLIGLTSQLIYGQCQPSDCPMNIPPIGTVESVLPLTGAVNPVMGQNGQHLRAVSLYLKHDAIDELNIDLIAPNGSSLSLSTFQGIQIGQNITFDICFFSCNETPEPDPGFPAVFESNAGYKQDGFYNGSYFPAEGCLEDLSGPINGTWRLEITDNFIQDEGKLLDWSLEFADNNGLDCSASCLPEKCVAPISKIGSGLNTYCENDSELNLDLDPQFTQGNHNTSQFGYAYIVVDPSTGLIIDVLTQPDLRNFPPGTYLLYGLSYHKSDWGLFPAPNGQYAFHDLIRDMNSGKLCLRPSDDHYWLQIQPHPELTDLKIPPTICPGDTIEYVILNYNEDLSYEFHITGRGNRILEKSDSIVSIVWNEVTDTFQLTVSSNCGSKVQFIPVSFTDMPDYQIKGPKINCSGDTVLYILSALPDPSYQYQIELTGGKLIDFSNDSLLIQWQSNQGENHLCSYIRGPECSSIVKCTSINVPDPQQDIIQLQVDSLCPGTTTYVTIDSNYWDKEIQWVLSGAEPLSDLGEDTLELKIHDDSDSAMVCVRFQNECGDTSIICKPIFVRTTPSISGLTDVKSCNSGVFVQSELKNSDSISWSQWKGPSQVYLPTNYSDNTLFELGDPGTYAFLFQAFNTHCNTSDTLQITLNDKPLIQNINTTCELDSYRVSFEIQKGSLPIRVNGDTLYNRIFESHLMASGSSFQYTIVDQNQCETEISGSENCPCVSYAEHEGDSPLSYCAKEGETILIPSGRNIILDGNDTLIYVIHEDETDVFGSEIMRSDNGQFLFSSIQLEYSKTYFASIVVANQKGSAPDQTDSCLYISNARPFDIQPSVFIEALDTIEHCLGSQIELQIHSEASYPLEVALISDMGGNKKIRLDEKDQHVAFDITYPIENWKVQHTNSRCPSDIRIAIQLKGVAPEEIEMRSAATVCVDDLSTDTISLNSLFLNDPTSSGTWTASQLNISGHYLILSHHTDTGTYQIEFTPKGNSVCPVQSQTVNLQIDACECISLEFPNTLELCNSSSKIHLPGKLGVVAKGKWTLFNTNFLENPPILNNGILFIENSSPGNYEIRFQPEAEKVYCANEYALSLQLEGYMSAGQMDGYASSYCQGDGRVVNLFELIKNEDPGGKWYSMNQRIGSSISIDSLNADIHSFTYRHEGSNACPSSKTQINIEITEKPDFSLLVENISCFGENNGSIEFLMEDDLNAPFTYMVNGKQKESNRIDKLSPGQYDLQATNYKGCYSDVHSIEIYEPLPFRIDLGPDLEVPSGEAFSIEMFTVDPEQEISDIIWYSDEGQLNTRSTFLEHIVKEDSYIWAIATNKHNCQAMDSVFIKVLGEDKVISLPNVINPNSPTAVNRTFGMGKIQDVEWIESIQIFDRWGNQLFIQRDLEPGNPTGFWDGTVDGVFMQEGVYIYNIVYKTTQGKRESIQGDVSILY